MGKGQSFQEMVPKYSMGDRVFSRIVLRKTDSHKEKNEVGPLPDTI